MLRLKKSVLQNIIIWCSLFILAGAAFSTPVHTDVLPLTPRSIVFDDPVNRWSYWFNVSAGMKVMQPPVLTLQYVISPTILPGTGGLTVLFNDVPLTSKRYTKDMKGPQSLIVPLPVNLVKQGINELRIVGRHRSIEGLCRDIDNTENWVRITNGTTLKVTSRCTDPYSLYFYPYPFINPLSPECVQSALVLPPSPSEQEIAAMLTLASDWGARMPLRNLPVRVSTKMPSTFPGNIICIGEMGRWPSLGSHTLSSGEGWLARMSASPTQDARLMVTGADGEGLLKAVGMLTVPETVEQLETGTQSVNAKPIFRSSEQPMKLGSMTFAEMGISTFTLAGAFHQSSTMVVKRPIRSDLGRNSTLVVKYRHAETLNPQRSLLSVFLNGIPLGSAALSPANAAAGMLKVTLPLQALQQDTWVFEFKAYHDLGTIDCSHVYDDVAWTTIDSSSMISLDKGKLIGLASLENFPYLADSDGQVRQPVTFWLSQQPSDIELTLAARVAMRAGQENRRPLEWRVVLGDTMPEKNLAGESCIIILGSTRETARFNPLLGKMLVYPESPTTYAVDKTLDMITNPPSETGVMQAFASPFNSPKCVAYALLAADDDMMLRMSKLIYMRESSDKLTGQVAVITRSSRVVTLKSRGPQELKQEIAREGRSYTWMMALIAGLCLIVLVLVLRKFVQVFIPKYKHPKLKTHEDTH